MTKPVGVTTSYVEIFAVDGSGSFKAFVALPATLPTGVVVVIQEIFGVKKPLGDTAHQFAEMGLIAVAPDLFWRLEPEVDLTDQTEAERQKAFDLMKRFDEARSISDLKATVSFARRTTGSNGKVGTVGYCLGGRLAFLMATRSDADINISYYAVKLYELLGELDQATHKLLVHIAPKDEFMPEAAPNPLIAASGGNKHLQTHIYPTAQHAFAGLNAVHFDRLSATIPNGRTAEALAQALLSMPYFAVTPLISWHLWLRINNRRWDNDGAIQASPTMHQCDRRATRRNRIRPRTTRQLPLVR